MCISDWSSDVCSSDLRGLGGWLLKSSKHCWLESSVRAGSSCVTSPNLLPSLIVMTPPREWLRACCTRQRCVMCPITGDSSSPLNHRLSVDAYGREIL